MVYGFWGLLALILFIASYDLFPVLKDWYGRIHIGRYNEISSWRNQIVTIGIKWLRRTPVIKATDSTRLVLIDRMMGKYGSHAIQYWQQAANLLGIAAYWDTDCDPHAKSEIEAFLERTFDAKGDWRIRPKHVDAAMLAYAVMQLDMVDTEVYKTAYDEIWDLIQNHIGDDGTVMYRTFMPHYRYVDTIGFICPFLAEYGRRYRRKECLELSIKQIKTFEKYGMLAADSIPYHAYHIELHVPLGLCGWGRGVAWYALGLIDAWRAAPEGHRAKREIEASVCKLAESVINLQQFGGAWNWTVLRGETRSDSSTTAVLAWFLVNAASIDGLREVCTDAADRAFRHLMKVTRRSGAVDFSQGDTKDIGVYSMLFNILPFTQGLCIRAVHFYPIKGCDANDAQKNIEFCNNQDIEIPV